LSYPKYRLLIPLFLLTFATNIYALSEKAQQRAESDLKGECLNLFTKSGSVILNKPLGYQYYGVNKHKVFFIVNSSQGQMCYFNHIGIFRVISSEAKETFEENMLEKCNSEIASKVNGTCELYARNDDIVYMSHSDKLKNAEHFLSNGDLVQTSNLLKQIEKNGFLQLTTPEKGKYEYILAKTFTENNADEALQHFNTSWSQYNNPLAAAEEASLLIKLGRTQDNWESIRNASIFFLNNSSDSEKLLYPNALENYHLTDSYFVINEEKKSKELTALKHLADIEAKKIAEEQRLANIEADKEAKKLAEQQRIDNKQAAKDAKKLAAQQRLYDIKAEKEAKKEAEQQKIEQLKADRIAKAQERRRIAEEKRLAKEGDGTADDYTCKSLGAKPGTNPYIQCRLKLTELNNQHQLEQIRNQQAIEQAQRQVEQDRQLMIQQSELLAENQRQQIERQRMLDAENQRRQAVAEEKKGWERLEKFGRALEGLSRTAPPVKSKMPHFLKRDYQLNGNQMCSYDDGTVINIGIGICPNVIR
jgi:hypothetical protein